MRLSDKSISLVIAACLLMTQLLAPASVYADAGQLDGDCNEVATADEPELESPYLSEFSGNSFRYENGVLKEDVEPIATFSIPQWPDNATGWGIDVSYAQGRIDWAKVKAAGCNFAILRCGYGSGGNDNWFKKMCRAVRRMEFPSVCICIHTPGMRAVLSRRRIGL